MKKLSNNVLSFLSALGVLAYVFLVVEFIANAEMIFSHPNEHLIPVFMLLLFIVSACITGYLVLGKPIFLYLEGKKKEAVSFLFTTVLWLLVFLFVIIIAMMIW